MAADHDSDVIMCFQSMWLSGINKHKQIDDVGIWWSLWGPGRRLASHLETWTVTLVFPGTRTAPLGLRWYFLAPWDPQDGWVTTKGNAGKVFTEAVTNYYTVVQEVDMRRQLSSSSDVEIVRGLSAGENFEVLEGPKVEKAASEMRAKARVASGHGWYKLEKFSLAVNRGSPRLALNGRPRISIGQAIRPNSRTRLKLVSQHVNNIESGQ